MPVKYKVVKLIKNTMNAPIDNVIMLLFHKCNCKKEKNSPFSGGNIKVAIADLLKMLAVCLF